MPKTPRKPVLPPTYLGVALLAMVLFNFAVPIFRIITFPGSLLGLVPVAIGTALNLLADRAIKIHGTTVKPYERQA